MHKVTAQPASISRLNPGVFPVGSKADGTPMHWGFSEVPNFNMCLLGESGSGKTYTLRGIIARIASMGITIHILDVKDDFSAEKFEKDGLLGYLPHQAVNDLDFSYVGGDCGLNILQFPKLPEAGGVYMAIQEILEIVHMFHPTFSKKMDGYLSLILKNVYLNAGITHDDQSTWSNAPPTLIDVMSEINLILAGLKSGLNRNQLEKIGALSKRLRTISKDSESSEEEIGEAKARLKDEFNDYVEFGLEKEQNYYSGWKAESVQNIKDTVADMIESGIFTRPTRKRISGVINRYRLVGLGDRHRQIVMRIVMSQVFNMAVAQTSREGSFDPATPSHFLVFDEGKHAKQLAKSELSPLNRIATEGRGYGVGMGVGVQLVNHVTEEMLKNFSTRVVLHVPEASYAETQKNFGVTKNQLKQLKAQSNCLFGMKGKYGLINTFR